MPFAKEPTRIPAGVGTIEVHIVDPEPTDPDRQQSIYYSVEVSLSNGETVTRTGNLVPLLTAAQLSALRSFMANLRTQAVTELLA